jgi:hypothetical protein
MLLLWLPTSQGVNLDVKSWTTLQELTAEWSATVNHRNDHNRERRCGGATRSLPPRNKACIHIPIRSGYNQLHNNYTIMDNQILERLVPSSAYLQEALRRDISRMVKRGLALRAAEGLPTGCAPVGYLNIRKHRRNIVILDQEKAPLVREAFALAASGQQSIRQIRQVMTDRGLLSRSGKPLSVSALLSILNNPFYCGYIRYNGEMHPGQHEALVPKKQFETIKRKLKRNRH